MKKQYKVKLISLRFLLFFLLSILLTSSSVFASASTTSYKLRIGYSSVVGARIFLWAAQDAGHFAKHGIDSELVVISGIQGIQALIAGDPAIFLGPTDTAVQAASQGADVIILATAEPIPYKLIVQPNIKTPDDLRKKKLAIDRIGGTSYHLTLRMLEKINIKPTDVELIPVAGGGSRRVLAVQSGAVSGVVTTIASFEEQKIPYRVLADSIEMGIKIVGNSFITTKRFRDQNRPVVENFIRASIDARSWLMNRKNRDAAEKIFGRYLRTTDPSALSLNYRLYVEPLQLYPYTDIEDLKANLALMPENNSLLRNVDLSTVVDNSFIRRVQQQASDKK